MKYIGGLYDSIQKELKLFTVEDIGKASMKATGIEEYIGLEKVKRVTNSRRVAVNQIKRESQARNKPTRLS